MLERQEAIAEVLANSGKSAIVKLRELFKGLPDLERGLVRIHFGKATPLELVKVLQAFKRVSDVFGPSSADAVTSSLLKKIVASMPSVNVDHFLAELNTSEAREGKKSDLFKESIDSEARESLQVSEARWATCRELTRGARAQDAKDCLVAVEYEMQEEIEACRKLLKKPALKFVKIAQEECVPVFLAPEPPERLTCLSRYLIEVRINESKKIVPDSWVRVNSTKSVYRFRSPAGQKKLAEIEQARERVAAEADIAFRRYLSFVESY